MSPSKRIFNVLVLVWLASYSALLWAATAGNTTLAQDFRALDFESFAFAAFAGFIGGGARTIYSLASRKVIVRDAWVEAIKDLIVSTMAGLLVYVFLLVFGPFLPEALTTRLGRLGIIVLAGAGRSTAVDWVGGFITDYLQIIRAKLRGQNPPSDPPPSAITPLSDSK